jgi:hypothetical protein
MFNWVQSLLFIGSDSFNASKLMLVCLQLQHKNDTDVRYSAVMDGMNTYEMKDQANFFCRKLCETERETCIMKCKHEDESRDT